MIVVLGTLLVEAASLTLLSALSSTEQLQASSDPASQADIEHASSITEPDQGALVREIGSEDSGIALQCPAEPLDGPHIDGVWTLSNDLDKINEAEHLTCQGTDEPATEDKAASEPGAVVEAGSATSGMRNPF